MPVTLQKHTPMDLEKCVFQVSSLDIFVPKPPSRRSGTRVGPGLGGIHPSLSLPSQRAWAWASDRLPEAPPSSLANGVSLQGPLPAHLQCPPYPQHPLPRLALAGPIKEHST